MNAKPPTSGAAGKRMASEAGRMRSRCRHRRMPVRYADDFVSRGEVIRIVGPVTYLSEPRRERPRTHLSVTRDASARCITGHPALHRNTEHES